MVSRTIYSFTVLIIYDEPSVPQVGRLPFKPGSLSRLCRFSTPPPHPPTNKAAYYCNVLSVVFVGATMFIFSFHDLTRSARA